MGISSVLYHHGTSYIRGTGTGARLSGLLQGPGVSASSGHSFEVRGEFYRKGKLSGSQDVQYRAIKDRQPVFGFAKTLHSTSASAVFAIGHIRDPYVVSPPSPRSEGTSYLIIFAELCDASRSGISARLLVLALHHESARRQLLPGGSLASDQERSRFRHKGSSRRQASFWRQLCRCRRALDEAGVRDP